MEETTNPNIEADGKCRFCGKYHGVQCPEVKAIEYHPSGSVKRVEFKTAADYYQQPFDPGRVIVGEPNAGGGIADVAAGIAYRWLF